jgi:hypothetical protein
VTEHFPSAHPSLSPAIMFTIPRNVLACVLLLLQASPPAMATRHAFDWNTGPGDGSVPARYSFGITATVGDTLVLSWQDPTTTPAGTMFHEVVRMADNSCNFANSYARARETDITNAAGVKTAVSSTITLDTVCPAAAHHHQTIRFNWDASLTSVCLAVPGRSLLFLVWSRICGLVLGKHEHGAGGDWRSWLHWTASLASLWPSV